MPRAKREPRAYLVTVKKTWKGDVFVSGGVIFAKAQPAEVAASHPAIKEIRNCEYLTCKAVYEPVAPVETTPETTPEPASGQEEEAEAAQGSEAE